MRLTKSQQERVNNFMRRLDIDPGSKMHMNCVRIHPTESLRHFMKKCEEAWEIYQDGKPFWSEAFTRNYKRKFDILDPLGWGIIELETDPKVNKKDADRTVRI